MYAREPAPNGQRGAVTAVASMQGYLLLAVARQLVVYHWTGSSLEEAAFFEAPMYIVSMARVRGGGAGWTVQLGREGGRWYWRAGQSLAGQGRAGQRGVSARETWKPIDPISFLICSLYAASTSAR